jgi:aryl-alcohol dehydrogenase-like predicted oxidoreductase
VAVAYLKHQPFPVIPILGTTKRHHLEDAIGALGVRLTVEQVSWLRDG